MQASDLIQDGVIVLEGGVVGSGMEEWMDGGFITPRLVREAISSFAGQDVTVVVNSEGGSPFAGEAIRAALSGHDGAVTARIEGMAASAASLMVMGADRIEMSAGSLMMIHDPATIMFGTADDLRQGADALDVSADAWASVYAARAGKTEAEMRTIMKEERWYGPASAVAEGFADAVVSENDGPLGPEMARRMEAAQAAHMAMRAKVRDAAKAMRGVDAPPQETAAGGHSQAVSATAEEAEMPEDKQPADTPETETMVADVTMQASRQESAGPDRAAMAADMRRVREMAAPFMASGRLTGDDVDAVVHDVVAGTMTVDQASQKFLSQMAANETVAPPTSTTRITRDETETRMEGMIGALMGQTDGPASEYRGLRLKRLAMELAGGRGYNDAEQVRRGMMATSMMGGAHGISDFSYITTEVMNRRLMAEYERRAATWQAVVGEAMNAADFRELSAVRFGGDFQMKKVLENGEYEEATLDDEAEGLKVERRGRTINITFEAVINDDMGAFARIPREFAIAARTMESSMVWSLIRDNAVLKSDSTALFHTAKHGNLASSGGALSVTTVGAARKAMWEQTAFGSKDSDDFLQISPDRLIVPPALEVTALQFSTSVTPNQTDQVNPFASTLTPVVVPNLSAAAGGSDSAWYLISSDYPPISHAYLDGYANPTVQTVEGMNPDKVTMTARHIFGAAPTEYRGAYKNAGG